MKNRWQARGQHPPRRPWSTLSPALNRALSLAVQMYMYPHPYTMSRGPCPLLSKGLVGEYGCPVLHLGPVSIHSSLYPHRWLRVTAKNEGSKEGT